MMNRILTFAGKARQRGLGYVVDLLTYRVRAASYRLRRWTQRGDVNAIFGAAPRPNFHFSPHDVPVTVSAIPEQIRQATILEAHQYLEHRFSFRGLPEVRFPRSIDWDCAPEGNTSWSWDLNRHRFFVTLGTAHHYAKSSANKSAFGSKLVELWDDWMRRNPPGRGGNWRSPFEVAARLRNWMWAYFLLAASPDVSPLFLHRAWRGLRDHASYLASHLEYHWPNNHLLLEALSLYEFALVFRRYGGERYLNPASQVLEAQVQQQVLADGVHSELCPMYHEIVASELGAFTRLCSRLGHALPLAMEERAFRMRRFSAALRRSDGSVPLLGDSSFPDTCLRFDASLAACSDLTYWLHHGRLAETCLAAREKLLSLDLFTEAGLGFLRNAAHKAHVTFDFGSFSRCATANHGHSDALSFEFHAAGSPWIVDSGFFHPWNIGGIDSWNRYFRSTVAHNTLVADGRDQNKLSDHNDIDGRARTRLEGYRSNSREVAITAEVEPHWSHGEVIHRREVSLNEAGEFAIREQIRGTGIHRLQWLIHFAPDLAVELSGPTTVAARRGNDVLVCEVHGSGPNPSLRLVRGERSPVQGWVALSSARVAPAWVLVVDAEAALPYTLDFQLCVRRSENKAESSSSKNELEPDLPELAGVSR